MMLQAEFQYSEIGTENLGWRDHKGRVVVQHFRNASADDVSVSISTVGREAWYLACRIVRTLSRYGSCRIVDAIGQIMFEIRPEHNDLTEIEIES